MSVENSYHVKPVSCSDAYLRCVTLGMVFLPVNDSADPLKPARWIATLNGWPLAGAWAAVSYADIDDCAKQALKDFESAPASLQQRA